MLSSFGIQATEIFIESFLGLGFHNPSPSITTGWAATLSRKTG